MPAGRAFTLLGRQRHGQLVESRVRAGGRPQSAREPVRRLRQDAQPLEARIPRPLAGSAPAWSRRLWSRRSLDRLGLGRRLDRVDQGLHALLGQRPLAPSELPCRETVPAPGSSRAPGRLRSSARSCPSPARSGLTFRRGAPVRPGRGTPSPAPPGSAGCARERLTTTWSARSLGCDAAAVVADQRDRRQGRGGAPLASASTMFAEPPLVDSASATSPRGRRRSPGAGRAPRGRCRSRAQ